MACEKDSWTLGAIIVLVFGIFFTIDLIWFASSGYTRLSSLHCPAAWHGWMLAQFVVLVAVISMYLWDHFIHYRTEMKGRWEPSPEGSHGILPFGKGVSVFWVAVEAILSFAGSIVLGFDKYCLDFTGPIDGWAYIYGRPYFVSAVIWVILHWVLTVGLALLVYFQFLRPDHDQTLRYGAASGNADSRERKYLIPQRDEDSTSQHA